MTILSDGTMMRLHGYEARTDGYFRWPPETSPIITPYDPDLQQPASYDLTLGDIFGCPGDRLIGTHEFILASTMEYVKIPIDMVARIEGKSSLARNGLMVHTAGFIDPGFKGQLTLEIVNHGDPFLLKLGMRIAQLAIQTMDFPAVRPYGHPDLGSHYQGQEGPTPAA